jgi:pimeloyl-ACP methyl ester carboxylesterase
MKISKLLQFVNEALIIYACTNSVLQDVWTPPSRITTQALRENYWLPSSLSTYDYSSGLHYLSYHLNQHHESMLLPPTHSFQAMHMNHGFGASAVSWLPVLPKLVERLQVRYSVAHDTPGFGFTDRDMNNVDCTSSEANAGIGIHLLHDKIAVEEEEERPRVLMGHSMGAVTTLYMATKLPEMTNLLIVLVSPALGLTRYNSSNEEKSQRNVAAKEMMHGGFLIL